MSSRIGHGASGAIRRFAGWVARGSVGHLMLEVINYWDAVAESPSQLEICFAIFGNVLELDDQGDPVNEKHAERRAATWLYWYCTGELPPGEAGLEPMARVQAEWAATLPSPRSTAWRSPSWRT